MTDETETMGDSSGRRDDRVHVLSPERVQAILLAINRGDERRLARLLDELHPADVADLMEQVGERTRRLLLRFWGREIDGETLSELDEGIRQEVIAMLPPEVLGEAVRDLDSDDVVDLVEALEDDQKELVLEALDPGERAAVEQALTWPEYSAGRLMQREVVRAPEHWTVGETIDFMRENEGALPEQFYHVVLIDPAHRPVGHVGLGKLLAARRTVRLRDITDPSFRTAPVDLPTSEIAYLFNQYHLISLPVVDAGGRLVGVVTFDDAMSVMDEEHEEDLLRLAGVGDSSRLSDRVIDTVKLRMPWLSVSLAAAMVSSSVIGLFEATIEQLVALAVLMPIVAAMGGNAGTQSLTVAVRAIATRDLTVSNLGRVIGREFLVGLANGLTFALVMGTVATLWFGMPLLGLVIGCAMLANLVVAALMGVLVPVTMDRFGLDPALASGAFVTTTTDVVGFFSFLGLATLILL